jgi:hypothetical protein
MGRAAARETLLFKYMNVEVGGDDERLEASLNTQLSTLNS